MLLAACKQAPPAEPPTLVARVDAAIARGADFLQEAQGPDGAVRSRTYAFFKDGWSLTPLAMMGLYAHPDGAPGARAKGVAYLRGLVTADGALHGPPDGPRYPLYSLALSILVLNTERDAESRAAREAMVVLLRRLQRADDGGWGYEDRTGNISATLFAVGALGLSGAPPDDPALVAARGFAERCQNLGGDGGFFFSPTEQDGNKAGAVDPAAPAGPFRSYGSATADGLRVLTRLGVAPEDPRLRAAGAWLEKKFRADQNPGDFLPVNEIRRASSYFYWAWTAAHALRALGKPVLSTEAGEVRWAEALAEELLRRQRPDGSWANPASEMREDDPVVATSFALASLGVTRSVLAGAYRSHAGAR